MSTFTFTWLATLAVGGLIGAVGLYAAIISNREPDQPPPSKR